VWFMCVWCWWRWCCWFAGQSACSGNNSAVMPPQRGHCATVCAARLSLPATVSLSGTCLAIVQPSRQSDTCAWPLLTLFGRQLRPLNSPVGGCGVQSGTFADMSPGHKARQWWLLSSALPWFLAGVQVCLDPRVWLPFQVCTAHFLHPGAGHARLCRLNFAVMHILVLPAALAAFSSY
jgi:hypothetical protein